MKINTLNFQGQEWQDCCKEREGIYFPLIMLNWTLIFLILALISGILGFTSIAGETASIARILFLAFLVLLTVSSVSSAFRDRTR